MFSVLLKGKKYDFVTRMFGELSREIAPIPNNRA